MQFNSHATSQDIVTLSEKLTKTNSTSFPIAEKTLYANQALRIILNWIVEVSGAWIIDDSNQTDLPEATANLVSAQDTYTLPTDADIIDGFAVKDSANNWANLIPVTLQQIQEIQAEDEFMESDGNPMYYRLIGNVVQIYPASNYSQNSSLKCYFKRDGVMFATTDTTAKPGFSSRFHEAVALYIALQYAKINQLSSKEEFQRDWDGNEAISGREGGYKKAIKKFYSQRFIEMQPSRISVNDYSQEVI
jgi:hypothetical protein